MWRQKPLYWQLLCFCKLSLAAVKEKVYVANTPTPHNTVAHFEYEQTNADELIQQFGQTECYYMFPHQKYVQSPKQEKEF